MAVYSDFEKLDIRIGKIIAVKDFPGAKKPAYQLTECIAESPRIYSREDVRIDFGKEIGIKHFSAQITNYSKDELNGRIIVAVVNFDPKQVANFISEVLVIGAVTDHGVKLLEVDVDGADVPLGTKVA